MVRCVRIKRSDEVQLSFRYFHPSHIILHFRWRADNITAIVLVLDPEPTSTQEVTCFGSGVDNCDCKILQSPRKTIPIKRTLSSNDLANTLTSVKRHRSMPTNLSLEHPEYLVGSWSWVAGDNGPVTSLLDECYCLSLQCSRVGVEKENMVGVEVVPTQKNLTCQLSRGVELTRVVKRLGLTNLEIVACKLEASSNCWIVERSRSGDIGIQIIIAM